MAEPRHEAENLDSRGLGRIGLCSALGLLAILAATGLGWSRVFPPAAPPADLPRPPLPRLQTHAPEELAALQARQRERLAQYGWVDRQAGVARIPIERAMALSAAGGEPR